MRIGCLHTAASNVAVLERAATALDGVSLRHIVRPDLLSAAGLSGLTPTIAADTRMALDELASDCDAVLLTCSSLGGVVDELVAPAVLMLRIDRALADRAVAGGGKITVLCAAPSSLEPTGTLFRQAALRTGAQVDLRLVPDAWADFLAGNLSAYHARIAEAVSALGEAATVALAQVSMADAVAPSARILTSPSIGLAAAVAAASR